jgi:hypothetical protein
MQPCSTTNCFDKSKLYSHPHTQQLVAAAHGVMADKYLSKGLTEAGRNEAEKALAAIRF